MSPRLVEVRKNILKQNDMTAARCVDRFHEAGVFVVSLVSSPGSGKTTFLRSSSRRSLPKYNSRRRAGRRSRDRE